MAVDCEGVRLSRFGRICVVQLAAPGREAGAPERLFLVDALRPGVVAALAPLLESEAVAKAPGGSRLRRASARISGNHPRWRAGGSEPAERGVETREVLGRDEAQGQRPRHTRSDAARLSAASVSEGIGATSDVHTRAPSLSLA